MTVQLSENQYGIGYALVFGQSLAAAAEAQIYLDARGGGGVGSLQRGPLVCMNGWGVKVLWTHSGQLVHFCRQGLEL